MKHPKNRKIPRMLLKTKMFKNSRMEDKVILGMHFFELITILLLGLVVTSAAIFLPSLLEKQALDTNKEQVNNTEIIIDTNKEQVNNTETIIDTKQEKSLNTMPKVGGEISHGQRQADEDR